MVQVERETIARGCAGAIFASLTRSAETGPHGVRWQTLAVDGRARYAPGLFDGVAGISLFLTDYLRLTLDAQALELATGGLRWSTAALDAHARPDGAAADLSLGHGWAGIGLAWLRLASFTEDPEHRAAAVAIGDRIQEQRLEADATYGGPITGFVHGAAGTGVFLVRLWEATRDERLLAAAIRIAIWLETHQIRSGREYYWPVVVGAMPPQIGLGFATGIAGTGCFLALLAQSTRERRWEALARGVAAALGRHAIADQGGSNWPDDVAARDISRCQWWTGAPGVGLFFTRAYEALGDVAFLEVAEGAAFGAYARGQKQRDPGQSTGLTGSAELFLELYRLTSDPHWLERADEFAALIAACGRPTPDGTVWYPNASGHATPDFAHGASGVGHFFLRVLQPRLVRLGLG